MPIQTGVCDAPVMAASIARFPKPSSEENASRRAVLTGLGSFLGLAAGTVQALWRGDDPPSFQTNVSQFIVFDPALSVPTIRLERLDGKLTDLASFRGTTRNIEPVIQSNEVLISRG